MVAVMKLGRKWPWMIFPFPERLEKSFVRLDLYIKSVSGHFFWSVGSNVF